MPLSKARGILPGSCAMLPPSRLRYGLRRYRGGSEHHGLPPHTLTRSARTAIPPLQWRRQRGQTQCSTGSTGPSANAAALLYLPRSLGRSPLADTLCGAPAESGKGSNPACRLQSSCKPAVPQSQGASSVPCWLPMAEDMQGQACTPAARGTQGGQPCTLCWWECRGGGEESYQDWLLLLGQ